MGDARQEDDPGTPARSIPAGVARRLNLLRIDTGAHFSMLVDMNGDCLIADGQVRDVARDQVARLLAQGLTNSLELARALRAPQPFTINYQAGALHDLYAANVGANYIIALIFDSQRGRTQIGAVWVYARRAVKDLLELLADMEIAPTRTPTAVEVIRGQDDAAVPEAEPAVVEAEPAVIEKAPAALEEEATPFEDQSIEEETVESGEVVEAPPPEAEPIFVSEEVNAFWDSVLSDESDGKEDGFGGLSLEEARAKGLLPSNFGE